MSVTRSSTRDSSAPPSLASHPDSLEQALKHLCSIEDDSAEAYREAWKRVHRLFDLEPLENEISRIHRPPH